MIHKMKPKDFSLISIFILAIIMFVSCEKESEWVKIDSVDAGIELSEHLDSIFSEQNSCLVNFDNENIIHAVYSANNIGNIDTCHEFSEINFSNYTLIVGKVQVYSISDAIASINLNSKDNSYKVEIVIDKCTECYGAIGSLYFWKLFPKLNTGYNFEMVVN